jgi:hypothetical protein
VTQIGKTRRVQRMSVALARNVVKGLAAEHGSCIRPVRLRRTDPRPGVTVAVLQPLCPGRCGSGGDTTGRR